MNRARMLRIIPAVIIIIWLLVTFLKPANQQAEADIINRDTGHHDSVSAAQKNGAGARDTSSDIDAGGHATTTEGGWKDNANTTRTQSSEHTGTSADSTIISNDNGTVVDCVNRRILRCPHHLIEDQTTPLFYRENTGNFLFGKCRDITIDTRSYCGF